MLHVFGFALQAPFVTPTWSSLTTAGDARDVEARATMSVVRVQNCILEIGVKVLDSCVRSVCWTVVPIDGENALVYGCCSHIYSIVCSYTYFLSAHCLQLLRKAIID